MHCVGNKVEIFQLKKDAIALFSAYVQEVNLKKIYIYIQGVTGGTDQTSGGCSLC